MNYEIQFAKVVCSGKLSDRFLSAQHTKSQELVKASMGEVFVLIEILSPWYNSAQIGQMIINNFSNIYYEGGSTSNLANFENTLKKINENLATVTQNGETEWIGNLNGILATLVDESLILSSTGKTEAYLFRDGKINHLTYGMSDKVEVHPLKTFSNIISGQLKAQDKVLVANKNLFQHLPLESLRQIITLNNASPAALQITKLLRKAKVKNVNLFIIELLSKEELANVPLKEISENVFYLDKSTESPTAQAKVFFENILAPLGKLFSTKIWNILKSTALKLRKVKPKIPLPSKSRLKTVDKLEPPKEVDTFENEFILKDSRDDMLKDEKINYSPDLYVHYYQEKKSQKENRIKNIFTIFTNAFLKFFHWLFGLYRHKEKRKYFYIIIAVILILIIGLAVGFKGRGGNNIGNLESQKILDEALASQKDGKNSLSIGEPEKAKQKFLESIQKAQKIQTNPLVAKDAQGVITTSYQELDKLTATTRLNNLEPIVTIAETGKAAFIVSGQAYLLTESDIYKASILGGKPQKVASLPKNKGNFSFGTSLGNVLYLYTSNQNLFEFDPSLEKLNQAEISSAGRWETANAMAGYVGNLYLLDGVLGQIYRHSSGKDVFEKGEEYFAGTNTLKQSLSLAIDGDIYVLKGDGKVLKLKRSKLQDFSLKNIPTPQDKIESPRKIYTDSDTPSLYILETKEKRILEFDKEGVFIRQYALPENFEKIADFSVSVKSKKIWILDDKNLYEITI